MTTTTTTHETRQSAKVQPVSFRIEWAESRQTFPEVSTWAEISAQLRALMAEIEDGGGYCIKTGVLVTFADGFEYRSNPEVTRRDPKTADLYEHMKLFVGAHSGLVCPAHLSPEKWDEIRRGFGVELEAHYYFVARDYAVGVDTPEDREPDPTGRDAGYGVPATIADEPVALDADGERVIVGDVVAGGPGLGWAGRLADVRRVSWDSMGEEGGRPMLRVSVRRASDPDRIRRDAENTAFVYPERVTLAERPIPDPGAEEAPGAKLTAETVAEGQRVEVWQHPNVQPVPHQGERGTVYVVPETIAEDSGRMVAVNMDAYGTPDTWIPVHHLYWTGGVEIGREEYPAQPDLFSGIPSADIAEAMQRVEPDERRRLVFEDKARLAEMAREVAEERDPTLDADVLAFLQRVEEMMQSGPIRDEAVTLAERIRTRRTR